MPPRLVVVEGSIGTGKTTTAHRLAEAVAARGARVRLVAEGDVEHPADLEQVALVDPGDLGGLLAEAPGWGDRVRAAARPDRAGLLVAYGVLERDHGPLPEPLRSALQARDAYEQPLPVHTRLRREQWATFVGDAVAGPDDVVVLECCLVQNPLTVTVLRDDAPEEALHELVGSLLAGAAPLRPVLVHLRRPDVGAAFRAAVAQRPPWWRDHVVQYYTGRGLGRRLGAVGIEGTVEVLRRRAEVEGRLLEAVGSGLGAGADVRVLRVDLPIPRPGAGLEELVEELVGHGPGAPGDAS
nr:hypothetical protein [uncultured Actinotalea sp.]